MKLALTCLIILTTSSVFCQTGKIQDPFTFLPKGYVLVDSVYGDLNKDSIPDCVLIIKGTDTSQAITDEYRGRLDRNRRGIIVVVNKNGQYELAVKNHSCFSSENEDGGVYFPPELTVGIEKGNLILHYGHGRYGYRKYIFRFKNTDFELIGYDEGYKSSFESEWVTFDEISINFLTKRKLTKEVIDVNTAGREIFRETWKKIAFGKQLKLSEISDFDELDILKTFKEINQP